MINFAAMNRQYPSRLLDRAVDEFAKLPGIGRKTALRLVLHLLRSDVATVDRLAEALVAARHDIKHCHECHNISDDELCPICSDGRRDGSVVCVVENIQDVLAVENTGQYGGLYHVLGGIISPMDGVGPSDIEVDSLVERVARGGVTEVILALCSTLEGDATAFYIARKLQPLGVRLSVIARGISVGDELEYTDEVTLGRSIINRVPYDR